MICMGAILEYTSSLEVLNCNFYTRCSCWFSKTYFWSATNQPNVQLLGKNRSKEKEKQAMVHIDSADPSVTFLCTLVFVTEKKVQQKLFEQGGDKLIKTPFSPTLGPP